MAVVGPAFDAPEYRRADSVVDGKFFLEGAVILGMPADIANATNRVGVILQAAAGTRGFYQRGKLAPRDVLPMARTLG